MKIAYRQGIISFQTDGLGGPQFLLPSSTPGFVDFDVSPTPTTVAFAHGASNYLVTFDVDATPGWGPLQAGVTSYLYWDVDLLTGNITRGITTLMPVVAPTAPALPDADQHWFDLTTTSMKVWNGLKWLTKIRAFAGYVPFGVAGSLVHYGLNSQVGLTSPADAGYILTDALLNPLRNGKGEFLTADTPVLVQSSSGTSGVLTRAPVAFMPVKATESIPAFSLVTVTGPDQVGLASGDPALVVPKTPVGIVVDDLTTGEVGMMTQYGEISSDTFPSWFATNIGKPVFCSPTGQLTHVRPSGLLAYRVGTIKSPTSLLFQIDAETQVAMVQVGTSNVVVSGQAPIVVPPPSINGLGEQVWTVTLPAATDSAAGHMTPAQVTTIQTHTAQIADLELTKAEVVHNHAIADVTNLQVALDGKSNVGHGHAIADVTNLQVELDGKAPLVHTHTIPQVTGLQPALDNKSDVGHGHEIAEVNLLQAALDSKSNVGHGHAISEVTNLQTELDGKAPLVHTHVSTDITDLSEAVDDRVSQLLVAGTNITLTYNDAANSLTIDAAGGGAAAPLNEVVFGTGASTASSSSLTYNDATKTLYANFPSVNNSASEVVIRTANNDSGFGFGELSMSAAPVGGASDVILSAGSNTTETGASGGTLSLSGGNGEGIESAGNGGSVQISAGLGRFGGDVNVFAGEGSNPGSGNGGSIYLQAGEVSGTPGLGGSVTIRTGNIDRLSINQYGTFEVSSNPGNAGQVLTSQGVDNAAVWQDPPAGLPAPTNVGYVIADASNQYGVLSSSGVPAIAVLGFGGVPTLVTGGTNGQVLTYNDSTSPPYTWAPATAAAADPEVYVFRLDPAASGSFSGAVFSTWSAQRINSNSFGDVTWDALSNQFAFTKDGMYEMTVESTVTSVNSSLPEGTTLYGFQLSLSNGTSFVYSPTIQKVIRTIPEFGNLDLFYSPISGSANEQTVSGHWVFSTYGNGSPVNAALTQFAFKYNGSDDYTSIVSVTIKYLGETVPPV